MKRAVTMVVRVLFGLFFLVMGLNYFFHFISLPPLSMEANAFMMALAATGYILPFNAGLQILTGFMLVFNFLAPLAILLLAPLIVNIALFHIFLDSTMLSMAIIMLVVEAFLAAMYWDNYSHLFRKRS